jgi:hypothetical protein
MQRLGPTAEFEHLAQHCDLSPRRDVPQHVQHSADCVGIRVIAIVDNVDAVAREPLAPHLSGLERAHGLDGIFGFNSEKTRNGHAS